MLGRAGAGFDGHRAKRGRTTLGEDYSVYSGSIGHAKKCAQVLRVFDAVYSKEQAGCAWLRSLIGFEEIFDREGFLRTDQSDDALMGGGLGNEGQLLTGFLADADAGVAALWDEKQGGVRSSELLRMSERP